MQMRLTTPTLSIFAIGATALILTIFAYLPGLSGGFLFDDFANINALGSTGPVDNWATFWRYITSGTADPTGRPVALLSFLIDGNNWPTDPYPFKRTNLILHLANGLLLGTALWRLGRILAPRQHHHAAAAAVLASALWLLHPLMVSTTLYIVQRQAMLPATFLLLALHGWISGRMLLQHGYNFIGATCMVLSIGGGTLLALLSKGNGILLPTLIGIIEIVILRSSMPPASSQRTASVLRAALLLAPSLLALGYLAWRTPHSMESTPNFRPWTLSQRLLTEPRILVDYLSLLFVPRPYTAGLYNDNILVSTSLLKPWTTLPAMLGILAMPIIGWIIRKRYPLATVAILFFWIGHLLESSVIPLELYYEHRNYLPAMFLFWPIAWLLTQPGPRIKLRIVTCAVIVLIISGMTHARSSLWGNEQEQALVWAALNPDSPRAQTTAALHEMHMDRHDLAHKRLASLESTMPDEIQIAFNRIGASCSMGALLPGDMDAAIHATKHAKYGRNLTFKWMSRMLNAAANGTCHGFTIREIEQLIRTARQNPRLHSGRGRKQESLNLEARIALIQDKPELALKKFNAALEMQFRPATALAQAASLGRAGYPAFGLRHLEHYEKSQAKQSLARFGMPRIHAWIMHKQGYWEHEVDYLQNTLLEEIQKSNAPS